MESGDPRPVSPEGSIFRASRYRPPDRMVTQRFEVVMKHPAEWREKATLYWEKARTTKDFDLREQYTELAARYLDMAEKFEDGMVAAAVLNARSRGN